jgi:hypothetical protein
MTKRRWPQLKLAAYPAYKVLMTDPKSSLARAKLRAI